jgi:hypothetical protein
MIARATNRARYSLPVRRLPRFALVVTALLSLGAGAAAIALAAPAKITPAGVGGVKLGTPYPSVRAAGLVGKLGPGCELAGPNTRSAPLRAPLKGSVDLTRTTPRRITTVVVRGGAAARGVGIGARSAAITAAFPKAVFDHSTDATFGLTLVRVPKSGGGRLQFAVDTTTKKVTLIGIPAIPFCE